MDQRTFDRLTQPGTVWWGRRGDAYMQRGWVADRSSSGIAFVSPFARRLLPGELISIADRRRDEPKPTTPPISFSVCRVEPYDEQLSLVACVRHDA